MKKTYFSASLLGANTKGKVNIASFTIASKGK